VEEYLLYLSVESNGTLQANILCLANSVAFYQTSGSVSGYLMAVLSW
jgi:hypothetical protein